MRPLRRLCAGASLAYCGWAWLPHPLPPPPPPLLPARSPPHARCPAGGGRPPAADPLRCRRPPRPQAPPRPLRRPPQPCPCPARPPRRRPPRRARPPARAPAPHARRRRRRRRRWARAPRTRRSTRASGCPAARSRRPRPAPCARGPHNRVRVSLAHRGWCAGSRQMQVQAWHVCMLHVASVAVGEHRCGCMSQTCAPEHLLGLKRGA